MGRIVLGLDIGGANLKAATSAGRAKCVPFAVWKQPEKLRVALRKLIAEFPEASEIAATMTAEICDCFETKREGVHAVIDSLTGRTKIRFWSTDGRFLGVAQSRRQYRKVASANWHASASLIAKQFPRDPVLFIDCGSTTTDIIAINRGRPWSVGKTDPDRLSNLELIYTGCRRTPAMDLMLCHHTAEHFATVHDAHMILGYAPEEPDCRDTADGRPATIRYAYARLARMRGGDVECLSRKIIKWHAWSIVERQKSMIQSGIERHWKRLAKRSGKPILCVLAGSGDYLAHLTLAENLQNLHPPYSARIHRIDKENSVAVSNCFAAYAVAVLASERP